MNIDNSTFCAAPWFQLRNTSSGNYQVCCSIDQSVTEFTGTSDFKYPNQTIDQWLTSDYLQYVRHELNNGNRIKECSKCWQKEDHGEFSLRQATNNTVTKNRGNEIDQTWINPYFKNKTEYNSNLLLIADIVLTNVCNFACSMCDPASSSKIYAHWQRTKQSSWIVHNLSNNPDYLNQVRQTFVEKNNCQLLEFVIDNQTPNIKILGGEPLLDIEMMRLISSMPDRQKQKTALTIVTNGSVSLMDTSKQLGNFDHTHFTVSLDGVGNIQDWVRKGSNWKNIENNLDQFCNQMPASCSVSIHCTVQALTLLHLDQLITWSTQRKIPLTFELLTHPECMSVAVIPTKIRNECYARLIRLSEPVELKNSFEKTLSPVNLVNMIKSIPVDTGNHFLLRNFLEWYDPGQQWKTIFPEWCEYLS